MWYRKCILWRIWIIKYTKVYLNIIILISRPKSLNNFFITGHTTLSCKRQKWLSWQQQRVIPQRILCCCSFLLLLPRLHRILTQIKWGVNKQRDIGKSCKNPRSILQLSVYNRSRRNITAWVCCETTRAWVTLRNVDISWCCRVWVMLWMMLRKWHCDSAAV